MPDERLAKPEVDDRPWHQKSPYAAVKHDPNELVIINGRRYQGVNKTLTREAFEQVRTGFRCIMCEEPQINGAFPEECAVCKFPMRKDQMRYLEKLDRGEEHVGTTIDWRKELDRMDGELERDNWEASPTSGIVVPKGALK